MDPQATAATTRRRVVAVALVAMVIVAIVAGALAAGSGLVALAGAAGPPSFIEETASSGVAHTYDGDYPVAVGGGAAVFDCDADGRPDLYVAGGQNAAALYRNESAIGGVLRFTVLPDPTTDLASVYGAYPLDVDGDSNLDLAVLRHGENVLLRGLGGCRFEPANAAFGLDGGNDLTTAFSATWEPGERLPTLAFGNYVVNADDPDPDNLCAPNQLIRPRPGADRYDTPIRLTPAWCALSVLFSDWDRSGRRDLRVSNDRHYYSDYSGGEEQLWRIEPGERPRLYREDDGWRTVRIWGMGIASQDITGDGYPETYLTSQGANVLQSLRSGPSQPAFRDIALERGVEATRPSTGGDPLPSTAWHPEFDDVNNDGLADLFVSKGNVDQQLDYAVKDPSDLFLGQPDGSFVEVTGEAGIVSFARGRGASLADLNLDGLPDLVVVNYRDPVRLWRNVGAGTAAAPVAMGHWIGLRLVEPGPNRDAIGAWIEIQVGDTTMSRELVVGGGHSGGHLGWTHVGLGRATEASVRVQWPDGEIGPWQRVAADGFVTIERSSPEPIPWQAPEG